MNGGNHMTVKVPSDQEIMREAAEILTEHMSPAKLARLWAVWQTGNGDYLAWRDEVFGAETVETLYEKVKTFQKES